MQGSLDFSTENPPKHYYYIVRLTELEDLYRNFSWRDLG